MRAMLVQRTESSGSVAEDDQILAKQAQAQRRTVRCFDFLR